MKFTVEKKITINFGLSLVLLLAVAGGAAWNATRFESTFTMVAHTHRVLENIWEIQANIFRMQSSTRGFILTGNESLLSPYKDSHQRVDEAVLKLHVLVVDNSNQLHRLALLDPALAETIGIMESRIQSRRTLGFEATRDSAALLHGQQAITKVRDILDDMSEEEDRLMAERVDLSQRAAIWTILAAAIGGALAVGLIIAAWWLVRRDYRARSAAEAALRTSEERTRQTIESVKDYAILRVDPLGRVVSWNKGAEQIHGYSPDEIIGQHITRFYPEEAVKNGFPQHELRTAAETGHYEDEGWRVRRDGSRFWANVVLTAIRDEQGELTGFVKITRDLSGRRLVEEKIRTLNENLQAQNAQLEAANHELESFSYSVSHDLRAPLRHIDGFAALLSGHGAANLDEKSRRYIGVISDSARRMGRLIDDLLSFSRMGRAQMLLAEIDHQELVAGVIRDGGFDRDPRVEWHVSPLPPVRGDAAMLRQVWLNLIGNAVKYSSRSPRPRIEIGGGPTPPTREQVFFIRDNGVGFDMKYAAKLFGVFQRLHSESEFEGTGIGLANVRRIVLRHGGRTWAESTPGAGATFFFSIPDQKPDSAATPP